MRITHQIGGDGTDVISQVHVFGEAPDDAIGLRQGRATLEYQVVSVRTGKEVPQRPDHRDVVFKQMGQEARRVGCRVERLQAFDGGELEDSAMGHQGADFLGHPGWQARPHRRDFFQFGRRQLGAQLLDRFAGFFRA